MNAPEPPTVPAPDVLAALTALAEQVARRAGVLVHAGRPATVEVAATKSSAVDVVTAMDLASEELIRSALAQARPQDGFLGEEDGHQEGSSGITWVVDPIDGTVNYLYGSPQFAVSVAAVTGPPDPSGWTVLAGCVHAPADGRTWTAGRGLGAYRDGRRLRVNEARPLARSLVGTGFGYVASRRVAQARVVAEVLAEVRDIRRGGAASIDLCAVADGSLDLYYERGLQPWDMAAGSLVAQEAGAVVTGLEGRPPGEAMVVAGPVASVTYLTDLLARHGADSDKSDITP